jgi:hypothetical protein
MCIYAVAIVLGNTQPNLIPSNDTYSCQTWVLLYPDYLNYLFEITKKESIYVYVSLYRPSCALV